MDLEKYFLPCIIKVKYGFDCTCCGMQRSVNALLHGDLVGAWDFYPPIYAFLFTALFGLLNLFFRWKKGEMLFWTFVGIDIMLVLLNFFIKLILGITV